MSMMSQLSNFDILFIVIIVLSTVAALFKGLFREIVGFGVIILGFVLAALYYKATAGKFAGWFGMTETVAGLLGFLGIFLGCILAGAIITFIVNRFLKAVKLKWMDRLLGAVFGFLRGWVVSTVLVLALTAFPLQGNLTAHSVLVPYLLGSAGILVNLTPNDLKTKFDKHCKEILHTWNKGSVAI
jgi:membrane protein required for colicin V production